jgi:uncharacterized protein YfaS (alpha-2-macroglobulin family)
VYHTHRSLYDRSLEKTPEQVFVNTLTKEFELSPAESKGVLELAKECLFGEIPKTLGKVKVLCASLAAKHGKSLGEQEMVRVELTLNAGVDHLENVAISDLLPGGFEIENPRITETTSYAFIKNAWTPQYMDIRDDRINLYTSFYRGSRQQVFYYMVRAVTTGTFQQAPVVVEAMYDGDYYSASGAGKVVVKR